MKQRLAPVLQPGWSLPPRALGMDLVLVIMALVGGSALFLKPMYALDQGTNKIVLCWSILGGVAAGLLWRRYRFEWLAFLVKRMPSFLFVTLLAPISALWSLEPVRSARLGLWLVSTTLIGVCIGYSQAPKSLMAIVAWTFAFGLAASMVAVLGFPDIGLQSRASGRVLLAEMDIGLWKGIFSHKNEMGAVASAALIFFTIAALHNRLPRFLAIFMVLLSSAIIIMSGSATAFAISALSLFIIAVLAFSKSLKFMYPTLIIAVVLTLPAWFWFSAHLDVVTESLSRDTTMTGRTVIWEDALAAIEEAPLLGHGYRAIWVKNPSTWFPHLPTTQVVGSAHNGYLQIAATLGVPAALIAGVFVIGIAARSFDVYVRTGSAFVLFCFVYTVWFMIYNVTEIRLFHYRQLVCIIFIALAVSFVKSLTATGPPRRDR